MFGLTLLFALAATASGPFTLPDKWVHGRSGEAVLQVHEAAPGTWVLRQSKTTHFEAPFLYLLAGRERAILLDSGAVPEHGIALPLRENVDALLAGWTASHGLGDIELVIAHTHGHADHRGGDAQFADRARTTIVPIDAVAVAGFFNLKDWPQGESKFDLGGRELTLLPLPGHETAHIAVFDPQTRSVFSGDSLYPGLITIRDLPSFRASIARLQRFGHVNAVARFLGAHIEMSAAPGVLYPLGSVLQPHEHALPMSLAHLDEMQATLERAGDFRHDEFRDDFALSQVLPASAEPPSIHGMLLVGEHRLWVSHLPMFHVPHNYQAIAEVTLPASPLSAYRADRAAHPESLYTIAPSTNWVLPNEFKAGGRFLADLYRGHFERGGEVLLEDVEVSVAKLVHLRRFEPGDSNGGEEWIAFGSQSEHFLAHRITSAPDFDQVVELDGAPAAIFPIMPLTGKPLAVGQDAANTQVKRVIYTEFRDLMAE